MRSILYEERSKPPQFNPILLGHCSSNLIEYDVDGFLHHSATDAEELARTLSTSCDLITSRYLSL